MSKSAGVGDVVRGGQTLDHVFGMAKQVVSKVARLGSFFFILTFTLYFVYQTYFLNKEVKFRDGLNVSFSWIVADLYSSPNKTTIYIKDPFLLDFAPAGEVYYNPYIRINSAIFFKHFKNASLLGGISFLLTLFIVFRFITRYGKNVKDDKHLRGSQIATNKQVNQLIAKMVKKSDFLTLSGLKLDSINVPFEWQPQHFSITGGSGTGKSVIYGYFIDYIRASNKRAIIHDRSGTYVERFYNPETDIILNPYDTRFTGWSLFSECSKPYHFDQISEVLFPETKGDPFWYLAPRLVFSSLALAESKLENPSTANLVNRVMRCTLEQMISICKGTDAMTILDKNGMKVAQTIRSIIATNIRHFRVFDTQKNQKFSIREWIKDDTKSGFIFVTSDKEKEVVLKPIITLWLDLAISSTLSMNEDLNRRIWYLIDELQALGQLVSMHTALAESRKYGGCFVIGFQGYSQACKIYTKEGVEGLFDCISTFIFTRCNGANTAEWAEKQLGKSEQIESNQTLSYGQRDVRDSQGQNQTKQQRASVLASELQNLPDLHAYIRFGRGIPNTKVEFKYINREKINPGIIERKVDDNFNDVEDVTEPKSTEVLVDESESSQDSVQIEDTKKQEESVYRNMNFDDFTVDTPDVAAANFNESIPNNYSGDRVDYDDEFDLFGDSSEGR